MYYIPANRTEMGHFPRKRQPKTRSENCQNSIINARESLASIRSEGTDGESPNHQGADLENIVKVLQESVEHYKSKAKAENTKYWNERRRNLYNSV
jgi:hypothetical protein